MPEKHTRQQLWEIYEKLPSELKEVILSEETAGHIWDICQKNKIREGEIPKVADCVGEILMGILSPQHFQEELRKRLGIDKETAQEINREIRREVFFPVRIAWEKFFQKEMIPLPSEQTETSSRVTQPESSVVSSEKPPSKSDVYREPVE